MSIRKYTFLGFVLTLASAVTGALMPDKQVNNSTKFAPGSLTNITDGSVTSITCTPDSNYNITDTACNASTDIDSETTISGENTSGDDTENNTTMRGDPQINVK